MVVLGAGPGGYAAAIRCAQLGLRTALVERQELGGACLNLGCIPSKAMLRSAEVLALLRGAAQFGLAADHIAASYGAVVQRRDEAVARLLQGLTQLLQANGVAVVRGDARLLDSQRVEIRSATESEVLIYRNLVIATGSSAARLPVPGAQLPGVIDSDGALALPEAPKRAVVVGGGAVGVEWAEIWRAFGSEVTVLEMLPQLVPTEEPEVARDLERAFRRKGIGCHTGARVQEIRPSGSGLEVVAAVDGGERVFPADTVLAAVGRRPSVESLHLEAAGLPRDLRGITTDEHMRTSVPHIFAVGDVTGRFLLAHVAAHQGLIAAETIAGHEGHTFDDRIVPSAIFTQPEIASVGLRERDAVHRGLAVKVGRFPFAASGRAVASGDTAGFVKVVAEEGSGAILGVHIIGPSAAELIGEASLAIRVGATVADLAATIHVHPTFSEALQEAAWVAAGTPLHVVPRGARGQEPGARSQGPGDRG